MVPPFDENWPKFFLDQGITIHTPIESPGRVDKKYVVIKNIYAISGPKKTKNSVKNTYLLKRRFEKSGFGPQIGKKWALLIK